MSPFTFNEGRCLYELPTVISYDVSILIQSKARNSSSISSFYLDMEPKNSTHMMTPVTIFSPDQSFQDSCSLIVEILCLSTR